MNPPLSVVLVVASSAHEDSEVRTLPRARTLTALGRLDPSRKTAVMQFLVEAELVQRVAERGLIIGLSGSNLSGAYLSYAYLIDANLSDAEGITNEDLERQARALEGVTMPNGQKYQEWLKDKEGRGEGGENSLGRAFSPTFDGNNGLSGRSRRLMKVPL
jgi:Pentapeptide repeats (8 copies)